MAKRGTTKYQSNMQESRIAEDMKGKVTVASGALDFQKADVRNDMFLVEAKTTAKSHYVLNIKTWETIRDQAIKDGLRIPLMCVDLEDGAYSIAILSKLDLWGLLDSVPDLKYVGNPITQQYKKSCRITKDFLVEDFMQDVTGAEEYFRRLDISLNRTTSHLNCHLVCLDWDDFIYLGKYYNEPRG